MRLHLSEPDRLNPASASFNPWPDFTAALQSIAPEMDTRAVVYEVDSFGPGSSETELTAAAFQDGEIIPGTVLSRCVDKEWLKSFVVAQKEYEAVPDPETEDAQDAPQI